MKFETSYEKIVDKIKQVQPLKYAADRNFIDGSVTRLSPYISRGVISTRDVLESVLNAGYEAHKIEKFIQELAWRDYWQQIWKARKSEINNDLKQPQPSALHIGIPQNLVLAKIGIEAVDRGIEELYQTGYMHNHLRMYVASIACNIARCHWKIPAQWMYYHLLDADWASNALGWQWICAANSLKLYFANQENINKYCHNHQRDTFLDVDYEQFNSIEIPKVLKATTTIKFTTPLPQTEVPNINTEWPTLVYNFYNLDPTWRQNTAANRILLLEPSIFEQYPVSQKSIDFCIALAKDNIPHIQIWVAEFAELKAIVQKEIYFKEHPLNHYVGIEDARDWMTTVKGEYPSFFAFWKKCKKEIL